MKRRDIRKREREAAQLLGACFAQLRYCLRVRCNATTEVRMVRVMITAAGGAGGITVVDESIMAFCKQLHGFLFYSDLYLPLLRSQSFLFERS